MDLELMRHRASLSSSFVAWAAEQLCPRVRTRVSTDDPPSLRLRASKWGRECHLVNTALVVVVALGLCWLVRALLSYELTDLPETFRPSRTMHSEDDASSELAALLEQGLRLNPEWCGAAAPFARVYVRYALLRHGDEILELVNPSWNPLPNASTRTVREVSPLCRDQSERARLRYEQITVATCMPPPLCTEETVEGRVAVCVQQLVDVLDGLWPCEHSLDPIDAMRVPSVRSISPPHTVRRLFQ